MAYLRRFGRHLDPRIWHWRSIYVRLAAIRHTGAKRGQEAHHGRMVNVALLAWRSLSYLKILRGACYFDTSNNDCPTGDVLSTSTRNANIKNWAGQIDGAGLPWLYWEVLPNADPHVRAIAPVLLPADCLTSCSTHTTMRSALWMIPRGALSNRPLKLLLRPPLPSTSPSTCCECRVSLCIVVHLKMRSIRSMIMYYDRDRRHSTPIGGTRTIPALSASHAYQ